MALEPGTRFGAYEVVEQIGAGGMGEVWRATDLTLKRDVALKVLPKAFVEDADRLARFRREAEILAALNHPNIATIHGLEQVDGRIAIVMELVDGPTLADRIAQGPIPEDEALAIAFQVADALRASHSRQIVHRDLKPANIKLRSDGTVKVLDFGISKAIDPAAISGGSPVMTTPAMTEVGMILGTAAYMSPEQARGLFVDERTDIWAFGCLLFEMLTGQPAFGGEDVMATLARVIDRDADLSSVSARIAPAVRHTIRLCLEKNPNKRIADIRDVQLALQGRFETAPATNASRSGPGWTGAIAAAAVIAAVVGVFAWRLAPAPETPRPVVRFAIDAPAEHVVSGDELSYSGLALSPDGKRLAYIASNQIFVRELSEMTAQAVAGTDNNAAIPAFSPDGQSLAWFSVDQQQIMRVGIRGGTPIRVADIDASATRTASAPYGLVWNDDDSLMFVQPEGIVRMPANGGRREVLVAAETGETLATPQLLPDGRVLYSATPSRGGTRWEEAHVYISAADGSRVDLGLVGTDARYLPTGHIVYALGPDLLAAAIDLDTDEVTGPVPVEDPVRRQALGNVFGAAANFAIAADGTLVYVPRPPEGGLVWVNRDGSQTATGLAQLAFNVTELSPDDSRMLTWIESDTGTDIWFADFGRNPPTLRNVTSGPGRKFFPYWINDEEMTYFSDPPGDADGALIRARADGTGTAEVVVDAPDDPFLFPYGVTPDRSSLIFGYSGNGGLDIGLLSLEGDPNRRPLLDTDANEQAAALSPNGEWLAYVSNQSGEFQVYVRHFPDMTALQQISTGPRGAQHPLWSADGTELFYERRDDNVLIRLPVDTGPQFRADAPQVLFSLDAYDVGIGAVRNLDYDDVNQRFLLRRSGGGASVRVNVVENFFAVIEERLPTR